MLSRGISEDIRSDNSPEFAQELRKWLAKLGTGTLYIEPGSPWENGCCEGFNGKLRDEMLKRRNLLLVEGGTDCDREVASAVQHAAPALGARLQARPATLGCQIQIRSLWL